MVPTAVRTWVLEAKVSYPASREEMWSQERSYSQVSGIPKRLEWNLPGEEQWCSRKIHD